MLALQKQTTNNFDENMPGLNSGLKILRTAKNYNTYELKLFRFYLFINLSYYFLNNILCIPNLPLLAEFSVISILECFGF